MKILRHPLHVMLIHFPTALLPMDLVLSYLFYSTGNESYGTAAFYCLIGGVGAGLLAGITGFIDLVMIKDRTAMAAALIHGGINLTAILVFSVFAYRSWNLYPQVQLPTLTVLIVKLLTVVVLFFFGYFFGGLNFLKKI